MQPQRPTNARSAALVCSLGNQGLSPFVLQVRLSYTDSQVRDLLHLRRLYYGKMGQLYRQRKELRSQVPLACMGDVDTICATDNYTKLSDLAEKLRLNAAEEYSVFVQSFCAVLRGVRRQLYLW